MDFIHCILAWTLHYLSQRWPVILSRNVLEIRFVGSLFHCNVGPISLSLWLDVESFGSPNSCLSVYIRTSWYTLSVRWRYACATGFESIPFVYLLRNSLRHSSTLWQFVPSWQLVEYVFWFPDYWLRHKNQSIHTLVTIRMAYKLPASRNHLYDRKVVFSQTRHRFT